MQLGGLKRRSTKTGQRESPPSRGMHWDLMACHKECRTYSFVLEVILNLREGCSSSGWGR